MIKLIVLDVDGTLTDGKLYMDDGNNSWKAFNVKDGFAIVQWINFGGIVAIITGKTSNIVARRREELGIQELSQGIGNKISELNKILEKYKLNLNEVAYIGDDINDLGVMRKVGFSACPNDAVEEVKKISNYISKFKGGDGAVREIIEKIMKDCGLWDKVIEKYITQK